MIARPMSEGLTITELAEALDTTVRALRHYESLGLITPRRSRRNTRLYGGETRERARLIVALRRADVPLETIEKILIERDGAGGDLLVRILEARYRAAQSHAREIGDLRAKARQWGQSLSGRSTMDEARLAVISSGL